MKEQKERRAEGATERSAGRRGGAWPGGSAWLGLGLLAVALAGGCATGGADPRMVAEASTKPVRLTLTNDATRAWQVSFFDLDGFEVKQVRLQAREAATIELAGGDYTLEQALLTASGAREAVRRLPLRLKAGGVYTWTLATLLTDAGGGGGERMALRE